jgi:hypothetical protein
MKLSRGVVAGCIWLCSLAPRVGGAAPAPAAPEGEKVRESAASPVPRDDRGGARAAAGAERPPAAAPPAAAKSPTPPPAAVPAPATGSARAAPTAAPPVGATAAPSPPAALAGGASAPAPAKPSLDGAAYAVRLRDLEARVDELKEQIRRSHTRLSLLSDTILSGGVGGARASIIFQNDMSGAFLLTRALFVLDGAVQYNKQDDTGALSGQKQIPIFKGSIAPGDHTLQVLLRLRGHGYGVFSYLRGYQFEVKQSHSFTITEGKQVDLDVIAWEKGGVTTPLEQRPAVRYLERLRDMPPPDGSPRPEPGAPRGGGKD